MPPDAQYPVQTARTFESGHGRLVTRQLSTSTELNLALTDEWQAVIVWDPIQERLNVRPARGFSADSLAWVSFEPSEEVAGRDYLSGEAMIVEDLSQDRSVAHVIAAVEGIRSMLSVPILINGQVYDVFGMN